MGTATSVTAQITAETLLTENRERPLGLDNPNPKFTWLLASAKNGKSQSAYQVQVSTDGASFSKGIIWDSDKIESNQSVRVAYAGAELLSLKRYYWRVRVWDEKGKSSKWSENSYFETGVLNKTDWVAQWIQPGEANPERKSPVLRSDFSLDKKIKHATATITSHGIYEAYLNGKKIGDAFLTPGWTSYNKRLQYQVYDVTDLLNQGDNAVGAMLGSGWYKSALGWGDNENIYGDDLALLLQINVEYSDGSTTVIATDENWKSSFGPVVQSEIYNGETVDARKEIDGWKKPGFNASAWTPVKVQQTGYDNLIATYNELIKKHETFTPVEMLTTPEGDKVIDFGQNLVGWVQVEVKGNPGDSIVIEHAEVLDKDGNFYTENLRLANQRNTYILKGNGTETFEPHFTWQGFRFIRIKGNVKNITSDNFKATALYSDMRKTGQLTTSNELLNQLQHNIQWGQRGNFLDVPTDCPQRDERLGWTGDAQVFAQTAAYNMHVDNFFTKWMKDVEADQLENGSVPFVVPNVLGENSAGSAGWADVATIIPWDMYLLYGNEDILKNQYESMKNWVGYMTGKSTDHLWNTGFHFGDWLFYRPFDDNDGRAAVTDKYLIAQCFYAHSTQLLINAAEVLGKQEDVDKYTALLKDIKSAFAKEYMTPNGRLVSGTQTAYVLALNFDMLPENLRQRAAGRLVENIKSYDYHLTTGFLGTPYLTRVLSRFGYHDVAYTLLMQKTYPSWLYPVTAGATTIWERWDGRKPDGTFQTPGMNSFNHYAYGAIGNWMYRELAGINSSEVIGETGYKKIILTPHFKNNYASERVANDNDSATLTDVSGSLETYYGIIESTWKLNENTVTYEVKIPVNTIAEIHLPSAQAATLTINGKEVSKNKNVTWKDEVLAVGSGEYYITFDLEQP
ncbi:MAG: alpha-L-rhamnosidase [Cytophagaceae bacterium]|nr:alpha-L-rhamnosidase [Cytophagaceae bacterium]|tara:strand:+ start:11906 stop:14629 length:2724 start_codon:yes stop_codon:yes gene_type:complete